MSTLQMKNYRKGIALMVFSSVCSCFGQLLWKLFTGSGNYSILVVGFFLYGIGALSMIVAYRYGKLSVLQPILSLNYVFGLCLAGLILGETITTLKVFGVVFIIYGLVLLTKEEMR